ncbi:MAG TPA: helix-turn-helix domain-containing protein [Bryobacteraceae bacterium]|nr:helix-turn-helix domain-containing protein [Bryobacteraceae bacterium]
MSKIGKRGINPGGILSTQEVATVLGISHPTLLKLLKEKKIPEPQRVNEVRHWNNADLQQATVALESLRAQGIVRGKGSSRK